MQNWATVLEGACEVVNGGLEPRLPESASLCARYSFCEGASCSSSQSTTDELDGVTVTSLSCDQNFMSDYDYWALWDPYDPMSGGVSTYLEQLCMKLGCR
jgi:hypothetical protein